MKVGNVLAAALLASLIAGPAAAQEDARLRFTAIMDSVFGPGAWRVTGGYRTPEREAELRRQGAMTVRPGAISHHSLGGPNAPGAYDIVVRGMNPSEAADRLRWAGAPFARYMPKGAHGSQGPHLHLEPYSFDLRGDGTVSPPFVQATYGRPSRPRGDTGGLVVVEGVRRRPTAPDPEPPPAADPPAEAPEPASDEFARLRKAALRDSPQAQLQLGRALLAGEIAPRDLRAGSRWLEMAASNPKADTQTRDEATAALEKLAAEPEDYAKR